MTARDRWHKRKSTVVALLCTIDSCNRRHAARGMCKTHYARWLRHGDPYTILPRAQTLDQKLWAKVDRRGPDECWPWLGKVTTHGYGKVFQDGRLQSVHRLAYQELVGEIPDGLLIDHTCHKPEECAGGTSCPHRSCCNPAHMEPVTNHENIMRGNTPAARHAAKTHCPQGHPYDEVNTRIRVTRTGFARACRQRKRDRDRSAA